MILKKVLFKINNLSSEMNLQNVGKTKVAEKEKQYELFTGEFQGIRVFGSTMNVSDSRTSNAHRLYLNMWLREMIK